jgi:integrase/recombinase XerD
MNAMTRLRFEEALKSVKLKKVNSVAISEDNVLNEAEVERLITESTDKTVSVMVEFLFATGLRISEMLGVLLTDIVRSNGKYIIRVLGKRRKERKVYVATALVDQVREQFHGTTYLFEHNGQPYNRISITNRIATQGRIILGRQISAHTLRHSFATATLKRTNNLKGVSKYLGHSSVSTTANLYVHSELSWDDVSINRV